MPDDDARCPYSDNRHKFGGDGYCPHCRTRTCGFILGPSIGMAQMVNSCRLPEGHDGEHKGSLDA